MKKTPEQIEFEQIYKQYSGRIYSFAMVISKGDTYLSEEILQTTFTKLWEHWGNLKSQDKVLSYLFTTAKNTFVNYCDHEMVKRVYADYLQSQEEEVDNMQEEGQDAKFLEEYIKDLVTQMPPQRQRVFVLSRFKHKTNKEIAQILNVSEKTVEVHITLALKQLREKLND
jgi:RNA polymerase sigma-70 factor (ECF subfamily)